MITVESTDTAMHVTIPKDEVSERQLNAFLDMLRHAQPGSGRITSVEPLPRAELERLYSQSDEFSGVTAEQLAAAQVQEEPQ